jgi:hypothetical protein
VQQQRAHEHGVACRAGACDDLASASSGRAADLVIAQQSASVRSWKHQQRPVAFVALVEVQTHRNHPLEHSRGRLDVDDTILDGPRPEPRRFDALLNGDGRVLVPE